MKIQTPIIGYHGWTQLMWAAIFLLVTALGARALAAQSMPRSANIAQRSEMRLA